MFIEYIIIFKYIFFCFLLAFLLFFVSFFLIIQNPNPEKVSVYECGFNPYEDSRGKFEVRFYIVAILFIIFDIEIAFLLPWVLILNYLPLFGFLSMVLFLFILLIGFIYEWVKGALNWI